MSHTPFLLLCLMENLTRVLHGTMLAKVKSNNGTGKNTIPVTVDMRLRKGASPQMPSAWFPEYTLCLLWTPLAWFHSFIQCLTRVRDVRGYHMVFAQHNIRFVNIDDLTPHAMNRDFPGLAEAMVAAARLQQQREDEAYAAQLAKDKAIEDAPALLAAAKAAEKYEEDEHDRMLREQEGRALGGGAGAIPIIWDKNVPDNWDSSSDDEDGDDKGGAGAALSVILEDSSGEKDDDDDDKGGAGAA